MISSEADPKDLFHSLAGYKDYFNSEQEKIDAKFKEVATQKVACTIASTYFGMLISSSSAISSDNSSPAGGIFLLHGTKVRVPALKDNCHILLKDLQPHLNHYGLRISDTNPYSNVQLQTCSVQKGGKGLGGPWTAKYEVTLELI